MSDEKAANTRRAIARVGRLRRELQRVARSGSCEDKKAFLLIPVDDELQLLEHLLGSELQALDRGGELSAHQEAAILDTLPDEVLEQLPGHDGPGHTEDGPADCRRCVLLREYGPALEDAARRLREREDVE